MRPVWIAGILACAALRAQSVVDPQRLPPVLRSFDSQPPGRTLECSVLPIRPALNFNFRFQAGYVVRVPMDQYLGARHRWWVGVRVNPEHGEPVYLVTRYRLPEIPKTKVEVEVGGGYLLGEGVYRVQWKMVDDSGRTCRSAWTVEARLRRSERKVIVAMPPGTVAELSLRGLPAPERLLDDAPGFRLTVMLHAAPATPRRTRLSARDRFLLLGTLSSLLERLPARSVRLVVFNLDQQRELYRGDRFELASLHEVSRALDQLELGLVDVRVLENHRGHVDLLANLMHRELAEPNPSDVVVVLGPASRYLEKPSSAVLDRPAGATPRVFFLEYRPPVLRMQATLPDTIAAAVGRMKGKRLVVGTPGEFAKAIDQVAHHATN